MYRLIVTINNRNVTVHVHIDKNMSGSLSYTDERQNDH